MTLQPWKGSYLHCRVDWTLRSLLIGIIAGGGDYQNHKSMHGVIEDARFPRYPWKRLY